MRPPVHMPLPAITLIASRISSSRAESACRAGARASRRIIRACPAAGLHYTMYERYTFAMARPASFRLPEELLRRINDEAAERHTSVTALVAALLDEGLKTRRFPGIVHRDGPTGRRAGVVGGPDVWEIVTALKQGRGKGEQRLRRLADELGLPLQHLRTALAFYAEFPDEIDERIAINERTARRLEQAVERRERLLSA
jgi:hypothetical protein